MRAYLIDPIKREISVVSYNGDYQMINELINSQRGFDAVYGFRNEDTLYVDDEGLLLKENHAFEFTYDNGHTQPLMGKALVLGTDAEGESVAVKSTLEEVASKVNWIGKVNIYHSQMGFEIVPIEADVEEAINSRIKEEVDKKLTEIAKGVNDGS
tara:strand:+ start:2608 stop:3072 length:465 start_codon:yes stop_codon:yes gene_type:complete